MDYRTFGLIGQGHRPVLILIVMPAMPPSLAGRRDALLNGLANATFPPGALFVFPSHDDELTIQTTFFEHYRSLERIDVNIITPDVQSNRRLSRTDNTILFH